MSSIAIVGMACCYPGASSPQELWENVLAKRRAFRRIPPERLRLEDYWSADGETPDSIYATEAAVIEGYQFDRVKFNVAGSTFREVDFSHWLALDVASRALADASFPEGDGLSREATAVIVGNSLTGEFSRAATLRLRWPFVWRVLDAALRAEGWTAEQRAALRSRFEAAYKAPFPAVGEETLAGGLSNTIAGRICTQFHFNGGGYTVDGACSSSLLAVANAAAALESGELSAALAGGVDLSLDPFELVGFSKIGALARGEMRVYDSRPTGFLPGEGCGFVVLMRHQDALAMNLRCYALIEGWGVSSDGGGGITRPELHGQRLAIRRAYARAPYGIEDVAYFEGHGTGTPVGDEVELRALAAERCAVSARLLPAVIGSVKGNIGHTKAAAGVAGLIKAVMALHTQILPPNTGLSDPHPQLVWRRDADSPSAAAEQSRALRAVDGEESQALHVVAAAEPWPRDWPLRAGVSSFGFGGINVHLTLQGCSSTRRSGLTPAEAALARSDQDAELFLLADESRDALLEQVERVAGLAALMSRAELTDLAACLARTRGRPLTRAAVVASTASELAARLHILRGWMRDGYVDRLDEPNGVFLSGRQTVPRVAFLFPGQASPVRSQGGALAARFKRARELYSLAALAQDGGGISTAVAQPAIVTAELAALRVLSDLKVHASIAVGHSLGELTALHWAGALEENALLAVVRARAHAMNEVPGPRGAMATVEASAETLQALLEGFDRRLGVAAFNSLRQTVVSGPEDAVSELVATAKGRGLLATRLPVSHAFHSAFMASAAARFEQFLADQPILPVRGRVISTVTGSELQRDENLHQLLVRQLTEPVRFSAALGEALKQVELCIEVGPGTVLTGLVRDSCDAHAVSVDSAGPSLAGLLKCIGAAYALGMEVNTGALFEDRFTRLFRLDWQPRFLSNPCEAAPLPENSQPPARATRTSTEEPAPVERATAESASPDALTLIQRLVAQRIELPLEAVRPSSRLLLDLHLNSITVGQIAAEAGRQLGASSSASPLQFADATVGELARALEELLATGLARDTASETYPAGIDVWVRSFVYDLVPQPLAAARSALASSTPASDADWTMFAADGDLMAQALCDALTAKYRRGVLVCLRPADEGRQVRLLLRAARAVLDLATASSSSSYFVLVQRGATASSLAKTLHLEVDNIITCVVDLASDRDAVTRVLTEVECAVGYHEAHYDMDGARREPRLRLLLQGHESAPAAEARDEVCLGQKDVLLVSGGGKGIAAECAAALAQGTGLRLVLLGRSKPEEDRELADNLRRFTAKGIGFRYFAADVSNATAVAAAVASAQAELGPITALLHGAGVNRPRLLRELTEAECDEILSSKVQGARNLLAAVAPQQLRLFVAFSSLIARTGMRGEAHYALANEWLSRLVSEFQSSRPHCRCIAIEWSVWSGVGMGERLGRIDALARSGISAITPDTGIAVLRGLVRRPPPVSAVVVAGRIGNPPTLEIESQELPFLRFLEQPRIYYPGVELIADCEISTASDPYLEDHVLQAQRIFPAVMALEAMAQAAMALAQTQEPPTFENVLFARPVVIAERGFVTLRICALRTADDRIQLALRCSETEFQFDHFRADCRFDHPADHAQTGRRPPRTRLALDPQSDLYDKLLFQKGRFRRLTGYRQLSATSCFADIGTHDAGNWFAHYLPRRLLYGDPASRDAAIHAIQACVPQAALLPVAIERLQPYAIGSPGPWTVLARESWREEDEFCYELEVRNADGTLRERWHGLRLKRVSSISLKTCAPPLLVPYIERRVKELLPKAQFSLSLEPSEARSVGAQADGVIRQTAGRKAATLRRPDGRRDARRGCSICASHARDFTLTISGHNTVACDLEPVVERSDQTWKDLLGSASALASLVASETGTSLSSAATRIWCALECLKKAARPPDTPLVLDCCHADGWVLFAAGGIVIASYIASLSTISEPVAVAILLEDMDRLRSVGTVPREAAELRGRDARL